MSFRLVFHIVAAGLLGAVAIVQIGSEALAAPPVDMDQIKPGMTADEVRKLLGPPKSTARQVLYGRYLEQWTYDVPAIRIEFDWRKGRPKQIQTVQTLNAP
jgi:hypothetical protein